MENNFWNSEDIHKSFEEILQSAIMNRPPKQEMRLILPREQQELLTRVIVNQERNEDKNYIKG